MSEDFFKDLDLTPLPQNFSINEAKKRIGEKWLEVKKMMERTGIQGVDHMQSQMTARDRGFYSVGVITGEFREAGLLFALIAGRMPTQKDFDEGVKLVHGEDNKPTK